MKDSTTRYVAKDQNIISGVQGILPALAPAFNRQAVTLEDRVQRRSIAFVMFLTTSHDRPPEKHDRTQSTKIRGGSCLKSNGAEIYGDELIGVAMGLGYCEYSLSRRWWAVSVSDKLPFGEWWISRYFINHPLRGREGGESTCVLLPIPHEFSVERLGSRVRTSDPGLRPETTVIQASLVCLVRIQHFWSLMLDMLEPTPTPRRPMCLLGVGR